jgi:hypothetical protein
MRCGISNLTTPPSAAVLAASLTTDASSPVFSPGISTTVTLNTPVSCWTEKVWAANERPSAVRYAVASRVGSTGKGSRRKFHCSPLFSQRSRLGTVDVLERINALYGRVKCHHVGPNQGDLGLRGAASEKTGLDSSLIRVFPGPPTSVVGSEGCSSYLIVM